MIPSRLLARLLPLSLSAIAVSAQNQSVSPPTAPKITSPKDFFSFNL